MYLSQKMIVILKKNQFFTKKDPLKSQ